MASQFITQTKRTLTHEHGGHRTAGLNTRLDHIALGIAIRIGLQLQQVSLEQDHFEQLVHALFGERGAIHENRLAAPVIRHESFLLQLLANLHRVRVRMVALVDGDEDGKFRGLGMIQGFERLRHDAIIGGHKDRIDKAGGLQVEQATKAPDLTIGAGAARRAHGGLDRFNQGITGIDVDASLLVGQAV